MMHVRCSKLVERVCVYVRERERVCVWGGCVCVRERESVCVCVYHARAVQQTR
jgi:hypothetical protein